MYIRFITTQKLPFNGRDGFPAPLVLIWTMNEIAKLDGGPAIYADPEYIKSIKMASMDAYAGFFPDGIFGQLRYKKAKSPDEEYGAFEKYKEGAVVSVETDNHYTYVVADTERAKNAMRLAADKFRLLFSE